MRTLARLVLALLLAAPLAGAQTVRDDLDQDGVADDADACPDTPAFDLVDAAGCSVCDCEATASGAPWSSRGDYVRCVVGTVRERRIDGTITRKEARATLRAARSSACGEHLVRCCVMFDGQDEGMCRVMDELRCDAGILRANEVTDLGAGSCLPNPCVR
ncbi:MAG TPA: hypothetical protein VMS22_02965 [Candidatus Eisenbacteria bacterium]|nr:hypothetical protein [Candidatus Eisenbacteria bacterium]